MYLGQIDFQHGLGIENPIPQGDSRISRAQDHRELRNSGTGVATDAELMAWAKRHDLVPPVEETS